MKTDEKINAVRQWMSQRKRDAVIIPSDDPHKSEYVAEHWQARKWISGFSGSAGVVVITRDKAVLWTDFRYYIQAQTEISGSQFELFKTGEPDVPTYHKWLAESLEPGSVVGIDANLFSCSDVKKLKKQFDKAGIGLQTDASVVDDLWKNRPPRPCTTAYALAVEFAGKSRVQKIGSIREKMSNAGAQAHIMSTLDDIAWTFNLRGKDVHTNPVNIAYALILPETATLFIPLEKIDDTLAEELKADGVSLAEYDAVFKALEQLEEGNSILIDPDNLSYKLYQSIHSQSRVIEKPNPAIALKAVKNKVEINHIRQTAVKDGVAMVNFLYWLEEEAGDEITEVGAATALYNFRKVQDLFVDNSFDPIMAFEDHSAMCHYSATPKTDVIIGNRGMFLTDSGGNYLTGTTDITRTVNRGTPTAQEIEDYTRVLKGHISVATTPFPKGTKGFQIDSLARQFLWEKGMNFGHGTGHGVGFFLCVHEGPARISPIPSDVALESGMLLTNEPGVYREGSYGIRLENQVLVRDAFENEFGKFLKFENVTFCHFERNLMDPDLLSLKERTWVNTYHADVYEKLSPHLAPEVAQWLRDKTEPV
jgi:Xaa-Pro aminopeptidase